MSGVLNFRNGGDNWEKDMLRDALTPDIMRGQMQNEVETYRPVVVYMNGEYWGIHNLRKGLDPAYFATAHHVEPGGQGMAGCRSMGGAANWTRSKNLPVSAPGYRAAYSQGVRRRWRSDFAQRRPHPA
jgi:hypothetical protein